MDRLFRFDWSYEFTLNILVILYSQFIEYVLNFKCFCLRLQLRDNGLFFCLLHQLIMIGDSSPLEE